MMNFTAQDWAIIIGAIFLGFSNLYAAKNSKRAAIASVAAADASNESTEVSKLNGEKLNDVHKQTNSNLDDLKGEVKGLRELVTISKNETDYYKKLIEGLIDISPEGTLGKVKKTLENERPVKASPSDVDSSDIQSIAGSLEIRPKEGK